ncbi:hypothetical protein [Phage blackswan219-1]|nr:hypothetical protein [Phage blackswan219-1]
MLRKPISMPAWKPCRTLAGLFWSFRPKSYYGPYFFFVCIYGRPLYVHSHGYPLPHQVGPERPFSSCFGVRRFFDYFQLVKGVFGQFPVAQPPYWFFVT